MNNRQNPTALMTDDDMSTTIADTFKQFEVQRQSLEQAQNKKELEDISERMGIDASKLSRVALDDARLVNRINEEYNRLNEYLIKTKNTCTYSEYKNNWFPLHELIYPGMPDYEEKLKERRELSIKYFDRFLSTSPILIVSDYNQEEVLAVIPPQYMTVNTIQGDVSQLLDAYTYHCNIDQEHLIKQSGGSLPMIMYAFNKKTPEEISKVRMMNFKANLKVLELFNPNHPLLQKIKEIENRKKQTPVKETKVEDTPESNVLDDNSGFSFF